MFHGGTNFGFSNGALRQDQTRVWTSSYDYGSPLDESGRTTESYDIIRQTIQKYVEVGSIPDVPSNLPMMELPEFKLQPLTQLFENLDNNTLAMFPMTMEALGQDYGFTLHEHIISSPVDGLLQPGDHARDRVIVYVNGNRIGVSDSQYKNPPAIDISLETGDKLQHFVENLGRVNYYSRGTPYENRVTDPYKGIAGNVTIGEIGMVCEVLAAVKAFSPTFLSRTFLSSTLLGKTLSLLPTSLRPYLCFIGVHFELRKIPPI